MASGSRLLLCLAAILREAQAASSKKKLKSLRAEFAAEARSQQTEYFEGASKILGRIAKLEEGDDLIRTSVTLGLACLNEGDNKCCAAALETAAKGRSAAKAAGTGSQASLGLERLSKFCSNLKAGRKLDALAWCRQALPEMELEFNTTDVWNMLHYRFYDLNAGLYPGLSVNDKPLNAVSLYIPGLTPKPWHDSRWYRAAKALERNFNRIAPEMDAFLANPAAVNEMRTVGRTSCQQDALLVKKGDWRDIGLYKKGVQDRRLCWKYFPHTCAIIERYVPEVPSCPWGIVSISRLGPGSDTMMHTGNSNGILTMHLGIKTPKEAGMTVGKETRQPAWQRGKITVFDDSFNHQVWHKGKPKTGNRVVLLIRFWHPDLTLPERKHKCETSQMICPDWLKERRNHLLTSPDAEARWKAISKEFRKGAQVK